MGDKKSGSKCYLKDTFPEVEEMLSDKTDSEHEVKSKIMNRKNIKGDTGCIKTYELCQVLQDPECPETVTIVKETFSREIRNSSTASEEIEAKSNRVLYCREIIKPYIQANSDNVCEDELICDALDATAADFPTFNFCSQAQGKVESDEPIAVDNKDSKKSCKDPLCQKPCYKKEKVDPNAVVAVLDKKHLYFADKTKICKDEADNIKRENGKHGKLDLKKEQTKQTKAEQNDAVDHCLEMHSKTVATLKIAAQDMLCKAYTTVKTICNKNEDSNTNIRIPRNCASEDTKPKKCSFENIKTTNSFIIASNDKKDKAITDNSQNITDNCQKNPNILNKALTLTKSAVNTMSSFHNILIREDLELYKKEKQSNATTENTKDKLNDINQNSFNNHIDIIENSKMRKVADCYDPCYNTNHETAMKTVSQKIDSIVLEEPTDKQYKKKKFVCGNSINNKIEPIKNISNTNVPSDKSSENNVKVQNFTEFNPSKLKFVDQDIVTRDTGEKCIKCDLEKEKVIVSEKEDTAGVIKTQQQVVCPMQRKESVDSISKKLIGACETVEPFRYTIMDSAGKITGSAYKASANVVDTLSEQKSYFVEKIKEHIDYIGTTLVEKKDSVSGRIEELKERILSMAQQDTKNDPFIDSYKDNKDCIHSKTENLMDTAKNSAKVIAVTGVELIDKLCSSTTSLVKNIAVKTTSLIEKNGEESKQCEQVEMKPPVEGLTEHLISTMSSTATRISKTFEDYHNESSPYDVPAPKPRDISMSLDEDDEDDDDDLNIGVFDSLKSRLYSMFYDKDLTAVSSESSKDPSISATSTSSRIQPQNSFIDNKP